MRELETRVPTAETVHPLFNANLRAMHERRNPGPTNCAHTLGEHMDAELRRVREQLSELSTIE